MILSTALILITQMFFCSRILRLSQRYRMASLCCILSFLRFLGGFYLTVQCYLDVPNTPNGVTFVARFSWLITSALAVGAAADVLIAVSMSYYLRLLLSPTNKKSCADPLFQTNHSLKPCIAQHWYSTGWSVGPYVSVICVLFFYIPYMQRVETGLLTRYGLFVGIKRPLY